MINFFKNKNHFYFYYNLILILKKEGNSTVLKIIHLIYQDYELFPKNYQEI
jgi:hypothetical protein